MLRNLNLSVGGIRILGVPTVGIAAETIAAETATGDNGPGILYNEATQPGYAGKELRAVVTSMPAVGTVFVNENGSVTVIGLDDGVNTIGYDLYVDGDYDSAATSTILVGAVTHSAIGVLSAQSATVSGSSARPSGYVTHNATGALTAQSAIVAGRAFNNVQFTQSQLDYMLFYIQENLVIPTAEQIASAVRASLAAELTLVSTIAKIQKNKMITDPASGMLTVYDDDGTTPLISGPIFEDAAGTQPYRGKGAERREQLT